MNTEKYVEIFKNVFIEKKEDVDRFQKLIQEWGTDYGLSYNDFIPIIEKIGIKKYSYSVIITRVNGCSIDYFIENFGSGNLFFDFESSKSIVANTFLFKQRKRYFVGKDSNGNVKVNEMV